MNSKEILMEAEKFFANLNAYDSQGILSIIDETYPEHDGIQDAEAASTLMLLIDRLSSIHGSCEDVIYKINRALE